MTIPLYQVDAFTSRVFAGNPAAVCPLPLWIDDALMQNIAMETNLAETAFFVQKDDRYEIRWFTPTVEVDLCGHATLASAHVLFNHLGVQGNALEFHSHRSGKLIVFRDDDLLTLDFPADTFRSTPVTPALKAGFSSEPKEAYKGKTDYMLVFESESDIRNMKIDINAIARTTDCRGIMITAKGDTADFVSRFFGPQSGIAEDPVTGSAHTTLTPYWTKKLGKETLKALQLSARQGQLTCRCQGDRVLISGNARTYLTGSITV
jgi:PhzF family phenazine biosynthesis protein